ncbi:MAG: LPS export ABC transporter periplasmic protein LptC [Bdellovibrio sp. CG10_big_fil_rev_8_21_14_0_10_47_8]|nr:MAG: LPS export ABC transporter periplasmic protein LptC [Bdellovibrio sp. CG10_big_fil_rev_8_21_14_0_10_47_8]
MKKFSGLFFSFLLIFLFVEILLVFPSHLEEKPETEARPIEASSPEAQNIPAGQTQTQQKMQGVHYSESRQGTRDWEFFSESAESVERQGGWKLRNVKVLFYNNDKVDFTVTGDMGKVEPVTRDMQIEGHVVTTSSNGYVFRSPSAFYKATERLLYSPGHVSMTGPPEGKEKGLFLEGEEMETKVEEKIMTIKRQVKAQKVLRDGKKLEIFSESAEFSGQNRMAKFMQNVSIQVESLKMEGPEATFEYRPGVDILQSVVVKGGVKVSDVDKYATSDSVRFDPEQNKFVFSGHPRVVQNSDELTGEEIVFIDGGKRVKVNKVKKKTDDSQ